MRPILCFLLALVLVPALAAQQPTQLALTFDDLPVHGPLPPGVTRTDAIRDLIAALKASGTPPVYGFINAIRDREQPADEQVLDLWRAAGYPLGNHTFSHMNLSEHTAAEWQADVLADEALLSAKMSSEPSAAWHWLRFPYLAEGDTPEKIEASRAFLRQHGYRIAGVTASFADYAFNDPYARCMAAGNTAAVTSLEDMFLRAAEDDLADRRAMSRAALGRQIPLVLLMHVGAFDARMLPRLLAMYRQHGVRFISLAKAERDPFYRNDLNLSLPAAPDTLEAAVARKAVSVPRHPAPNLDALCR